MSASRRQFMQLLSALPFLSPARLFAQNQNLTDRANRIASVISEFSNQGIHRTGTDVDAGCAEWLVHRLREYGVTGRLDPLQLERIEILAASFEFDGVKMEGIPLFDCTYTDENGISGTLGPIGSSADIGVIMLPPSTASPLHSQLDEARRNNSHKAMIAVTDLSYPREGIAVINAEDFREPVGPPVLQIANTHWDALQQAMNANRTATVVAQCERVPATAYNVSARIAGRNPSLPPMVIMTPRSSWWESASERGGGIAMFLELARDLAANLPERDILFTANTGHELSHLGLDQYLHERPTLIQDASVWIHLGANFAARGSSIRLQYSDERFREVAQRRLGALNLQPGVETPIGQRPLGEARNIFDGDGRFLSILGNNPLFHHPHDLWPDAVDLDTTAQWTAAFSVIALELSKA